MGQFHINTAWAAEEGMRSRLLGEPLGLDADDWPRAGGHPMQLLATIDLGDTGRPDDGAILVFADTFYGFEFDNPSAFAVRRVSREAIDAGEPTPAPAGFEAEALSEEQGRFLEIEAVEEGAPEDGDSYLGGEPIWPEETSAPSNIPDGAFLACLTDILPGPSSSLYVYEGGAVAMNRYHLDDYERVIPWSEAIEKSRELVLADKPPGEGMTKYGGLPAGVSEYDWPTDSRDRPLHHLMTLSADLFEREEDDDTVALAFFVDLRRAALSEWESESDFIQTVYIEPDDLEEEHELPEGVEALPEKTIELRSFPADTGWRALRGRNLVGPRGQFRNPQAEIATSEGFQMQLEASFIPGATVEGTLYFVQGYSPTFQVPGETGSDDGYDPFLDDGFDEYDDTEEGEEPTVSPGLRRIVVGGKSKSWAGGLPPNIGLESWPRYQGELMTHIMTVRTDEVPDISRHRCAAYSVFLSTANHHKAYEPHTSHAVVLEISEEQLETRIEAPGDGESVEVLGQVSLSFETVEDGESTTMNFAGGRPRWIQSPQSGGAFVAQITDDIVDVNLGDTGTLYIFDETAFFQCY